MSDKKGVVIDRLQKLINSSGKSREEIAKAIECDTSTITKHYNGNRQVAPEFIIKYAQFFGVSADYLLGLSDIKSSNEDKKFIAEYTGLSEKAINKLHKFITPESLSGRELEDTDYRFCEENKRLINDFISSTFFDSIITCEDRINDINIDFISFLALFFGDYEYYNKINHISKDIDILTGFKYLNDKYLHDSIHGALNDDIDLAIFQLQKSMINRYEKISLLNRLEHEQNTFDFIRYLIYCILDAATKNNGTIEFFNNQIKDLYDNNEFLKDRTNDIKKLKDIYEDFKKNNQ